MFHNAAHCIWAIEYPDCFWKQLTGKSSIVKQCKVTSQLVICSCLLRNQLLSRNFDKFLQLLNFTYWKKNPTSRTITSHIISFLIFFPREWLLSLNKIHTKEKPFLRNHLKLSGSICWKSLFPQLGFH